MGNSNLIRGDKNLSIQLKRSLTSDIDSAYILLSGQIGIDMPSELNSSSNPFKFKIGDGKSTWNQLPFFEIPQPQNYDPAGSASSVQTNLITHIDNHQNPHQVTPTQIGAALTSHMHTKNEITDFPGSLPASDVYAWAKAASKPSYTAVEVGAIATSAKGTANGVASLDANSKIPIAQIPTLNYDASGAANTVQSNLNSHTSNRSNPHGVTTSQIGALSLSGGSLTRHLSSVSSAQVRNIELTTSDQTVGASTSKPDGTIIYVYEA